MSRRHLSARPLRALLATLCAAAFAACGGGNDPTAPSPTQAALVIKNASALAVTTIRFDVCSASSWGPNRLNAGETIAPGAKRAWQVTPGCYDVRVVASTGDATSFYARTLEAGKTREFSVGGSGLVAGALQRGAERDAAVSAYKRD